MMEAVKIQGNSISAYLSQISKYPLLSAEEEMDLAWKYRNNADKEAAWKLITSNLRFVVKIAHEYSRYRVRLADLIQEGNLGLMRALQKFDPSRGYRFISYAVWWIRAFIQSFILKTWSLVKLGTTQTQRRLFFSLEKARREIDKINGIDSSETRKDDAGSLSSRLNANVREIEEMDVRMKSRDVSLDVKISDDSNETYLDMTPDSSANFQDEVIRNEDNEIIRKRILESLDRLNKKERYIIENRVMADEPKTLDEIGKMFGVTRERIRQIESKAMEKIKGNLGEFATA